MTTYEALSIILALLGDDSLSLTAKEIEAISMATNMIEQLRDDWDNGEDDITSDDIAEAAAERDGLRG